MADTTVRVLTLLQCLQARRFWTGPELAAELGVTPRCVRKDVQRLRDLGYPVHASGGVEGGDALGAGEALPPLPLDADEALAVALGLRVAAVGEVQGLEEPAVRALAKLQAVLPRPLRERLSDIQTVTASVGRFRPVVDGATLAELAGACREGVVLSFGYTSRDGEATWRRVEPYRLVHADHRWYLLAWDLDRADWRTFRVDRVGACGARGRRFTPRSLPDEDVARYVARTVTARAFAIRARMRVHAPRDAVADQIGGYGWVESDGPDRCWLEVGGTTRTRWPAGSSCSATPSGRSRRSRCDGRSAGSRGRQVRPAAVRPRTDVRSSSFAHTAQGHRCTTDSVA